MSGTELLMNKAIFFFRNSEKSIVSIEVNDAFAVASIDDRVLSPYATKALYSDNIFSSFAITINLSIFSGLPANTFIKCKTLYKVLNSGSA